MFLITGCQFQLQFLVNPDAVTIKSTQAKHTSAVTRALVLAPDLRFQLESELELGLGLGLGRRVLAKSHKFIPQKKRTSPRCRWQDLKAQDIIANYSLIYLRAPLMGRQLVLSARDAAGLEIPYSLLILCIQSCLGKRTLHKAIIDVL